MTQSFLSDLDFAPCQPGSTMQRFPLRLKNYGVPAMRKAYDLFNKKMKEIPDLKNSVFALESYPVQGVKSVSQQSTAYAFRDDPVLISPFVLYTSNASLDALASKWGRSLRQLVLGTSSGEQMHTYINYAHGSKSLELSADTNIGGSRNCGASRCSMIKKGSLVSMRQHIDRGWERGCCDSALGKWFNERGIDQ
jgi:hypothetical protein